MKLTITVYSQNLDREKQWKSELTLLLTPWIEVEVEESNQTQNLGQILFIDEELIQSGQWKKSRVDRRGRVVFIVVKEQSSVEKIVQEQLADDWIVSPFRALDLVSRLRTWQQFLMLQELHEINLSFTDLLQKLKEDLELAERLQKSRLPKRFPKVKGYRISSRYFAGMKSGGDYFDLAESRDSKNLGIVLSHSSTYGLSSAFLSILMRVAVKISTEQLGRPGSVLTAIQKIQDELLLVLKEKDVLSLFYGSILRSERIFRYINLGESMAFLSQSLDSDFEELPAHGASLSKISGHLEVDESVVQLEPDSRLVLISGGAVEALGGKSRLMALLNQFRRKEPADFLNEIGFQIKSKLQTKDDMPEKDCTAILLDTDSRVLKLSRPAPNESLT